MNDPVQSVLPNQQKLRRLALAYLAVFGEEGKRNSDQKLVWEDMESFCFAYRLVSEAKTDGEMALHRALFNDGRRSWWLRVRGSLKRALMPDKPAKISR